MKPAKLPAAIAAILTLASANGRLHAQQVMRVEFPDPANFYQNTIFAIDGDVAVTPSFDNDVLWSFSLITGELLDADGLVLPEPATASTPAVFANHRIALGGWFPGQGILVADAADPTNLTQLGIIQLNPSTNIQGQNIEVAANGVIGYIASFPNDTLYSFNVETLQLEDPAGLPLPGNPDRIALAGDRVAIVDTDNGRILVADVSNPANLTLAGVIELPAPSSFRSNDNIVFAADERTAFVSSQERVLYSFDVVTLSLLDPDGIAFGTQSFGDHVAIHGDRVACIWSRGLSFIDVSDPTNMTLISDAQFGGTVAPQGSATVEFTADGAMAAIPVVFPDHLVYTFEVATGNQVSAPFPVDEQPNFLTVYGANNRVGVLCSGNNADNVLLISGLFGATCAGDLNGDGFTDLADLGILLADFGCTAPGPCPGDLDNDGDTDLADLGILLADFGCAP